MKKLHLILVLFGCVGMAFAQNDGIDGNRRAFYECSAPLDIDTSQIEAKSGQLYFQFNVNQKLKNLEALNFIWLNDSLHDYFTGYLVNTTDSTFTARRQDGSLIMIQEALDSNGTWQPIEYWVYSGCGNSYFSPLKLAPNKCVLIPIKKYSGDFKTQIRLKFKNGNAIIYSEPFEGTIVEAQLKKVTENVNGILYYGPANYLND